MKVLTWNIAHRNNNQSFIYALEKENADLIFLQECFHPLTYLKKEQYKNLSYNYLWEPTNNGWGNLILCKRNAVSEVPLDHIPIDAKFKGRILAATIETDGFNKLTLLNLHTPIEKNYSRHNMHAMFDLVKHLIIDGNTIICGDLNFGECFDRNGSTEHKDILDKIISNYKLINCYKKYNNIGQTFRPSRKPSSMIMIDYVFMTEDLEERIKNCQIINNDDIRKMSDHNPLIVNIE